MPVRRVLSDMVLRVTCRYRALQCVTVLSAKVTVSVVLLVLSVALLVGATNNAFIYTRF